MQSAMLAWSGAVLRVQCLRHGAPALEKGHGRQGVVPAWRGVPALEKGHNGWGLVPSAGEREVSVTSGARNQRERAAQTGKRGFWTDVRLEESIILTKIKTIRNLTSRGICW
jgi:hypothetical protein